MFLATTALDEFWDRKDNILFLGEWCLLYGKEAAWKNSDYVLCEYPWDTMSLGQASAYCGFLNETILERLAQFLNEVNGRDYSKRYWRIIIGSWLVRYIEALFDRYTCVEKAMQQYGQLRTWGLADSLPVPYDYQSFQRLYIDDLWNLKVFTQICEYLGVTIDEYKGLQARVEEKPNVKKGLNGWSLKNSYNLFEDLLYRHFGHKKILFSFMHLPKNNIFRFILSEKKIVFSYDFGLLEKAFDEVQLSVNEGLRTSLVESLMLDFKKDKFASFLVKMLQYNFPLLYLEGYKWTAEALSPYLEQTPSAIVTATGHRASRAFPFFSAEMSERGCKLITWQHGGSFGTVKISPMELHDQMVSDEYWTWGWEDGLSGKCRRLPSLLLSKYMRNDIKLSANKGLHKSKEVKVLYCCNSVPRYLYLIWSNPVGSQWKNYIEWQHKWIAGLSDKIFKHLLVRLPRKDVDYGWFQKKRLTDSFSNIKFDDFRNSLVNQLFKHDIIVVDSNHTVMLESLIANKPTVLFWNPTHNALRKSAQKHYDELIEAGILHFSPEGAATKVNAIYADPYKWWLSEKTQKARIGFCNQFAYTVKDPFMIWRKELKILSQKG